MNTKYVIAITSEMDKDNGTVPLACMIGRGVNPPRVAMFDSIDEAQKWVDRGEEFDGDLFDYQFLEVKV